MLRTTSSLVLGALLAGMSWAQAQTASPSFEVASIKPAAPQNGPGIRVMMRGGPGSADPGQITYSNVSLRDVVQNAYGVKRFQIVAPDWLETTRFDIVAKVPPGATKEDLKPMLQNLLAERFRTTVHHESKEMQAYALVISKHGLKLKESTVAEAPKGGDEPPPPPLPPPPPGPPGAPRMGKDGFPQMAAGRPSMWMMVGPKGMRMTATVQPISALIDMLGNHLQHPVVDETGLKGKYDFTIDFAPDEHMMGPMGGPMPPLPGAGPGSGAPGGAATAPEPPTGPSLFTALEEQLGLKLETKKVAVDLVVIDHIEKAPTEN
jgi:uncharacterized protein (TIGR03435 family)